MKKFILNFLLFSFPIIFLFLLFILLLPTVPNDYSYKNNYLIKNAEKIEVLILGSSHSYYGINPSYFSFNTFNSAHVSQDLKYDLLIFNKFKNHLKNLNFVILPISYFTFFSLLEESKENWRIQYYNIYYLNKFVEIDKINIKGSIKSIIKYYILHKSNINVNQLGFNSRDMKKQNITKSFEITGKEAALRHTKDNFNNLILNKERLEQLLNHCIYSNIKVILFTPPALDFYTKNLNLHQLEIAEKTLREITKSYKNVSYYNLLNDKRFDKQDFYDADHVNYFGAKKLSNILNEIVYSNSP